MSELSDRTEHHQRDDGSRAHRALLLRTLRTGPLLSALARPAVQLCAKPQGRASAESEETTDPITTAF